MGYMIVENMQIALAMKINLETICCGVVADIAISILRKNNTNSQ